MSFKDRFLNIWNVIGLVCFFGFILFIVSDFVENEPKAQLVQNQLEVEFKSIEPLPGARAFNYKATHKTSLALVSSNYKTALPYSEIRAHYDTELGKCGWVFFQEERIKDWGRNFGGKTARYCKGEYRADLQYAGEKANYGWDFSFSVSWGLGSPSDKNLSKFSESGCR